MKQVGFLWNRTVVIVVDKLSSTSVDFIRSERELKSVPFQTNQLASRFIQQNEKSTPYFIMIVLDLSKTTQTQL